MVEIVLGYFFLVCTITSFRDALEGFLLVCNLTVCPASDFQSLTCKVSPARRPIIPVVEELLS